MLLVVLHLLRHDCMRFLAPKEVIFTWAILLVLYKHLHFQLAKVV
jgi:hypothetical protein